MTRRLLPVLVAVGLAAAGCSDDSRDAILDDANEVLDDATETAVRNFARLQAEEQFNAAGNEIDSEGLTCTAAIGDDRHDVRAPRRLDHRAQRLVHGHRRR